MKIQSQFDNLFDKYNEGKHEKVLETLNQIDLDNEPPSPARTWAYKTLGELYFLKDEVSLAAENLGKAYASYEDTINYMEYIYLPELVSLLVYCLNKENMLEKAEKISKATEIDFLASGELGEFYKYYYQILVEEDLYRKQELLRTSLELLVIDISYKNIIEEFLENYEESEADGHYYIQRLPYYYDLKSEDDF